MSTDLFEIAAREKFRFESPKGLLGVEELFDLPLTSTVAGKANLNDIAVDLFKQIKDLDNISFVTPKKIDPTVVQRLDIVKRVIEIKQAENAAKLKTAQDKETLRILDEAIAAKKSEKIAGTSLEDLEAQRAALLSGGASA